MEKQSTESKYVIRDWYPKYIKTSYNSIEKKKNLVKQWAEDLNKLFFKGTTHGAPGWLSWVNIQHWLRS